MKKVPKSILIGGSKFDIEVGALKDGEYGLMFFDERKIVISTICLAKQSLLRETLRHEIMHAALHMSGISFGESYCEEVIVRAIENIFFPAWDGIRDKIT